MNLEDMQPVPLPDKEDSGKLLASLVGRDVKVTATPALKFNQGKWLVGTYVHDSGEALALFVAEPPLAAGLGAALAMLPVRFVEEAKKTGEVPANLLENYSEVVNVFSRLLNSTDSPHLKLRDINKHPAGLAADVEKIVKSPGRRVDFNAAIQGFGEGKFALLVK